MIFVCNSNNNSSESVQTDTSNAIIKNSTPKKSKHEFKVLTTKEVSENRSKAYEYLMF